MSEANTSMKPAPAGLPPNPSGGAEQPTQQLSKSPVNSDSSSSKANQQATAAGEPTGLHGDNKPAETPPPSAAPPVAQPQDGGISLTPTAPSFLHVETGNKTIDQVATLLSNQQFEGAQGIIQEMMETQELSLTSKADLVKGLGADVAALVINQLETSVASVKEAGQREGARLKQFAQERFGGADAESTWAGLQRFAQSPQAGLTQTDRKVFNELLAKGGTEAELVIDALASKYEKSTGYTKAPTLMEGTSANTSSFQPLNKADYQSQIGPAVGKYGEASQEVQALRQRRAISISRGY